MENRVVLVVDKDPENVVLVESRLRAREFSVRTASSSRDALDVLKQERFDLILLSARMELVDGEELAEKIRRATATCYVPVIMMLGEDDLAALIHGVQLGFDDFLMGPFDALTLQMRVLLNIKRAEERMQANPLTKLPGNVAIERTTKERISENKPFSVCYLDVNHFKSFNDIYGYDRGDDVIRQTARIILQTVTKYDPDHSFVGHVGGDDFIVILHPDEEAKFARECMKEFDRIMPTYYSQEEVKRGYITVKNRKGKSERFPLMSIAIAAVTNLYRKHSSPAEIAQVAAEVKKFLKTQPGSSYLRDRRERQIARLDEAVEALPRGESAVSPERGEPLGQFLLAAGLIDEQDLAAALKEHFSTGKRLGQVLISMNLVRSFEVGKMLEKKLGVPYIDLTERESPREVLRLFTADYVRTHRVIPIELGDGKLRVAMLDPFDLKVIDDIERVTGYQVVPGLALEEEFEQFFDRHYLRNRIETL